MPFGVPRFWRSIFGEDVEDVEDGRGEMLHVCVFGRKSHKIISEQE